METENGAVIGPWRVEVFPRKGRVSRGRQTKFRDTPQEGLTCVAHLCPGPVVLGKFLAIQKV